MIGQTIAQYMILEKLGEVGLTVLRKRELRRSGPVLRSPIPTSKVIL